MSEQDPLLQHRESDQQLQGDNKKGVGRVLGPLEISRATRYCIVAGLGTATFLSALNQTLVPTMLPSISSEFNKSNQASWLGTAYLLATCSFTPLYGRLCNLLGRKRANHTALFFSALGVIICGLSTNMYMLIVARFLSGIGGGGLLTTASIVVNDMYSHRSRGLAQGVTNIFYGLGLGLGGPFGGMITDWLGWRWAFLIQCPVFFLSFVVTSWNLNYVTEAKGGKSARDILKRIDYLGSLSLMLSVGAVLVFLSVRYNESLPWSDPAVITSLVLACVFAIVFLVVEIFVAPEPVLAPSLLKQKIPLLVGASNLLVSMCNFTIMYFFPMWFQTVVLTNAATAGLHLLPNSISMSVGSIFGGWIMHVTGRYKTLNLVFGICPFIGASLIYIMKEDSGPILSWLSIIPLGFGNSVVLQTMIVALLVHLPDNQMAVGTGFGQLFRGIGQVGGVAISSAIFQSCLEGELRSRIHRPDAEDLIKRIRESATLVISLPPDLQRIARDSYSASLKWVFLFGACSSLLAYLVRLPIPDKVLERRPREAVRDDESSSSVSHSQPSDVESEHCIIHDDNHDGTNGNSKPRPRRDDGDAVMDPEHGGTRSTPRCNC